MVGCQRINAASTRPPGQSLEMAGPQPEQCPEVMTWIGFAMDMLIKNVVFQLCLPCPSWQQGGFRQGTRDFKLNDVVVAVVKTATNCHFNHKTLSGDRKQCTEGSSPDQLPEYTYQGVIVKL